MRILLIILSFTLSQIYSSGKTILIKTNIKKLKTEEVGLFHSKYDYVSDYFYYKEHNRFEIENYHIIYESHSKDTLIIEIGKNIPIFIQGLNKIQSDSIIISDFKLIKYSFIDSSFTTTKYIRKRPEKYHIKEKSSIPLGSMQVVEENISIYINGKEYTCYLISEPYNINSVYCTPGKISYSIRTCGVRKYYVVKV